MPVRVPLTGIRPPKTREALLAAARRLVVQDGTGAVTVRAVARNAGTTTPAVYALFGSKEGLLQALAERAYELLGRADRPASPDRRPRPGPGHRRRARLADICSRPARSLPSRFRGVTAWLGDRTEGSRGQLFCVRALAIKGDTRPGRRIARSSSRRRGCPSVGRIVPWSGDARDLRLRGPRSGRATLERRTERASDGHGRRGCAGLRNGPMKKE